jgi:hypothetical protein
MNIEYPHLYIQLVCLKLEKERDFPPAEKSLSLCNGVMMSYFFNRIIIPPKLRRTSMTGSGIGVTSMWYVSGFEGLSGE